MEIIKNKEDIVVRVIVSFFAILILNTLVQTSEAVGESSKLSHSVNGIWKLDVAKTVKIRIVKGVPWHVGSKYGVYEGKQIIREFDHGAYRFYDEKTRGLIDSGKYRFIKSSSKNEIVVRILPEDNRYNINECKVDELVRFSRLPGDNVPCIIGFRFIDDNTVESFSFVRDFGKNKMIKKDDNACWKRIPEIPKMEQKGDQRDALN